MVTKILSSAKRTQNNYCLRNLSDMCSSIGSTNTEEALSTDSVKQDLFEIGSIYSCFISYVAKYEGDLSIKFAERVLIIKDDGEDFVLVKNLSTRAFGYVPRDYIVPVFQFLEQLV